MRKFSRLVSLRTLTRITHRSVVTIEESRLMPKRYSHLSNDIVITMCAMGDQEARQERVIREIMATDNIKYLSCSIFVSN